jgi:SAM-dependent methyltransferase
LGSHRDTIVDQFTKQASLFQATHRSAESATAHAIRVSGVGADDVVLDVACGPGVLTCAFARVAAHVTGIDITPTMLEHARAMQASSGVTNVDWQMGDVYHLPFEGGRFSMAITRYSFHHFERPRDVLKEMVRVCRPGGHVVIIDSAPPPEKADAFNEAERLRDPSHTRALSEPEILEMMEEEGLAVTRRHLYAWENTVESLLGRSFPEVGDRERLRRIYQADLSADRLAMNAREVDGELWVTFPTLIAVGRRPDRDPLAGPTLENQ